MRFVPEVLTFIDRNRDRRHELEMQRVMLEFQKANPNFGQASVLGGAEPLPVNEMQNLSQQVRDQLKATGTKLDWVSVLVRPSTTYALVVLYLSVKAYLAAFHLPGLYTDDDYALLGGILAFWFADRTLKKAL